VLAVVLGLLSGVTWGVADFLGGVASRRASVLAVVGLSQGAGLVLAVAGLLILRPDVPPASSLALGVAAGLSGVAGLVAFYRAMSVGSISLVAPISALGALVPLTVDLASGNAPGALSLAGMVVALAGAALAASAPGPATRDGLGLALLAALGFGGFFSLLAAAATDSALWSLTAARCASAPTALALALAVGGAASVALRGRTLAIVVCGGALDATANLLFAAGTQRGLVSVVAVLGSLYPVTTIALAGLVLHERLGRLQGAGAGVALAGVVMIAAG
jgi:drug/metabolite transporter (DMT)-like permease